MHLKKTFKREARYAIEGLTAQEFILIKFSLLELSLNSYKGSPTGKNADLLYEKMIEQQQIAQQQIAQQLENKNAG